MRSTTRMSDSSSSELVRTAKLALRLASRCVSEYSHPNSRKDFTQRQLLACLVIRGSRGLSYRATAALLADAPAAREALGLARVPHFTTLESFANSVGVAGLADTLLHELMLEIGGGEPLRTPEIAVDSTGLSATGASVYFEHKRGGGSAFVKLSAVVVCALVLPCAMVLSFGRSNDMTQGPEVVARAGRSVRAEILYADAGYDGERLHRLCREEMGVKSWIPPVPKTRDGSIRSPWRSMMNPLPATFGRRWMVESFFSALKRTTGGGLRARGTVNPLTEAAFRVVGYAVRR